MVKIAKWLGGGLGFVLGGPIGALIGFVFGTLFDLDNSINTTSDSSQNTAEGDFKVSLLILMACVMKADGNVRKSELAVVKKFLVTNFGEQGALEALSILKELLKKDINENQVAMQINRYMNYASKLELLHFLFAIAYADGELSTPELNLLQRTATIFRISPLDIESLRAPYSKGQDTNWAYKVLEIEPSATNDEIKKAYRSMAKKYHPDKLNALGEDVKKVATEKFRSVNDAYENLKKQRGFT